MPRCTTSIHDCHHVPEEEENATKLLIRSGNRRFPGKLTRPHPGRKYRPRKYLYVTVDNKTPKRKEKKGNPEQTPWID